MKKYSIYLPTLSMRISSIINELDTLPDLVWIDIEFTNKLYMSSDANGKIYNHARSVRIKLDERKNELIIPSSEYLSNEENIAICYIKSQFDELKKSNFLFGTDDEYTGYIEPSETMYTKDFLKYLKKSNRDLIIDEIIN